MSKPKFFVPAFLVAIAFMVLLGGCSREAKKTRFLERADAYFNSGEYEKARIEYLNVLKLEPVNPRAIRQLGYMWQEQGVPVQAYNYLLKAHELKPNDDEILTKLGLVYLAIGEVNKAHEAAVEVLARNQVFDDAMLLLAETAAAPDLAAGAQQWLDRIRPKATSRPGFHLAIAQMQMRAGDLPGAMSATRQALQLDPKSALAHMVMADLSRSQSNVVQVEVLLNAGKEYKLAAELAPMRSFIRLKYAQFKATSGDLSEAKRFLNELTAKAPDYLPALSLLAEIAFSEKEYDECIRLAQRVVDVDQSNFRTRQLLAQSKLTKGKTIQGVQDLETLNNLYPKTPQAKYQLALAYLQTTNIDRAEALLEQAVRLNTDFTEALILNANLKLRKGDAATAVASMLELVKKHPEAMPAHVVLVDGYRLLRQPEEAMRVLRGMLFSFPRSPQPAFMLGMYLREQGKNSEARTYLEKASALAPDDLKILYELVDLDIVQENYELPLTRLRKEIQSHPDMAGLRFLEGRVYRAKGDMAQAVASLKKALELDPGFVSAYQLLATTYVSAEEIDKAINQLELLVASKPNDLGTLMLLGTIHEKAKNYEKARQVYEKLLAINGLFVPALNNLSYIYAERLGQVDKGHDLARKAKSLAPGNVYVMDTLGWILFKRKEYQEAMNLLQEGASMSPSDPVIQYHLGLARYMMGQAEPAKLAFQRSLASQEQFEGADEARRYISLLSSGAGSSNEGSVAEIEGMIKANPNDVVARSRLAELYKNLGQSDKAAKMYEEVIRLSPQNSLAMVKLAGLYEGPLQDHSKALELVKRARVLSPNDTEASHLLGKLAFRSGDHSYSYNLLRDTASRQTNSMQLFFDLGWAAYSMGRVAEAKLAMQRCLALTQKTTQADSAKQFLNMIGVYEGSNSQLQSEPAVTELLKTTPNHAPALMALGQIQLKRGAISEAINSFEKALNIFPNFSPAKKQLASLYAGIPGKEDKAFELAMSVRAALPGDVDMAKTLGKLSHGRKDYRYAVTLLQEALRGNPNDAESSYFLGVSFYRLNDIQAANAALRKALAGGLAEPMASEARSLIIE